jgi:hypothetical protein
VRPLYVSTLWHYQLSNEGPSLETSTFSLYFSGSCISRNPQFRSSSLPTLSHWHRQLKITCSQKIGFSIFFRFHRSQSEAAGHLLAHRLPVDRKSSFWRGNQCRLLHLLLGVLRIFGTLIKLNRIQAHDRSGCPYSKVEEATVGKVMWPFSVRFYWCSENLEYSEL